MDVSACSSILMMKDIRVCGQDCACPLYGHEIPVMAAECFDDKGTGIVIKTGDSIDAEWYEEHRLPYKKTISNGKIGAVFLSSAAYRYRARKHIISLLRIKVF